MTLIVLSVVVVLIIVAFAGVLFFGAPYLPTLNPQIDTALKLLDLKQGQTLLELGSGDGKVLIAAAKTGINVVGIELNPFLVIISWLRTIRYRKQVKIIWGSFWTAKLPQADAVFVFLLDRFMERLDRRLSLLPGPFLVVSFAFKIPSKQVDVEKNGLFLYHYK